MDWFLVQFEKIDIPLFKWVTMAEWSLYNLFLKNRELTLENIAILQQKIMRNTNKTIL